MLLCCIGYLDFLSWLRNVRRAASCGKSFPVHCDCIPCAVNPEVVTEAHTLARLSTPSRRLLVEAALTRVHHFGPKRHTKTRARTRQRRQKRWHAPGNAPASSRLTSSGLLFWSEAWDPSDNGECSCAMRHGDTFSQLRTLWFWAARRLSTLTRCILGSVEYNHSEKCASRWSVCRLVCWSVLRGPRCVVRGAPFCGSCGGGRSVRVTFLWPDRR